MVNYTIYLHTSSDLYDHCDTNHGDGYQAIKRAATFFEGAFNQEPNHSGTATPQYFKVPAPIEMRKDDSGFTAAPCDGSNTFTWLHNWFEAWLGCQKTELTADYHLLLTSTSYVGGGATAPDLDHGVAITGRYIAGLPSSYSSEGFTSAYNGMATALHEFGHHAMGHVAGDHLRGDDNYYDSSKGYAWTPMLDPGALDGNENYCNDYISTSSPDGHVMHWDDCCTQEW